MSTRDAPGRTGRGTPPASVPADRSVRPGRAGPLAAGAGVLLAVAVVVVVVVARGAAPFSVLGVSEPGPGIRVATVLARTVALGAGGLCLGGLVAACVVLPSRGGARGLSAHGYATARGAGRAAVVWALAAAASVPLAVLSGTGGDVRVLGEAGFASAMAALQEPVGLLLAALAAATVAAVCRVTLSWRTVAATVPLAALAVVAPVAGGHPASVGGDHDVVLDVAVLAALATAVWLGATAAAVAHARRGGPEAALVATRARRLSLGAAPVAVVATLVVDRWLVAGQWTGRYGLLALAQAGLLLAAAAVVVVPAARRLPGRRRSGTTVVAALSAAMVLSGLLATDAPPGLLRASSAQQTLLGFDLPGPPTAVALLAPGRVNVLFDLVALVLAVGYLAALLRLRRRGDSWPVGRSTAWLAGCALLAWTLGSGLGDHAKAMFSAHMAAHMALGVVVPALLVLGGPLTLAGRAWSARGPDAPDGPHAWARSALGSPAARTLTHPLVSLALFAGSAYALYFTPVFAAALPYHWAHQLIYGWFLAVGVLFFWPIVGVDRSPHPLPPVGRLVVLLASMPFHLVLGVLLVGSTTVIGRQFYGQLTLPWVPDLLADQVLGGDVAWAGAELPLLAVLVVLLVQWSRAQWSRPPHGGGPATGDGDRPEWDALLAQLAREQRGS